MFQVYYLLLFLFSACWAEESENEVFKKLSEINEKWLQLTSMPETAFLLQHPPYSYHLSNSENVNISDIILQSNLSQVLRSSTDEKSCSDDLLQVFFNIESSWALQMVDSDGKISTGLLRGGLIWPGHFDECTSVYAPKDSDGHGDFHGQYCVATWEMNVGGEYSTLPLSVGLCVPDSCTSDEIKTVGKDLVQQLGRIPLLKKYASLLTLKSVSCKAREKPFDAPAIIYTTFVFCFVLVTVVGSAVTVLEYRKRRAEAQHPEESVRQISPETSEQAANYGAINADPKKNSLKSHANLENQKSLEKALLAKIDVEGDVRVDTRTQEPTQSIAHRILTCFSIFQNGEKILNTGVTEGQLPSIHGIRFLSLSWVILGHTYITVVSIVGNRLDVLKEMDSILFQGLLQAPFSVDSFFFLSGFLLAYLFLKEADRKNGKISWLYFYVHRFWRLTPAYMVVVLFYIYVFKFLGSGPFWDDNHCNNNRDSWWKYLLYINNFIPINDMCVGWSWYLANDMQFYIISPLFLYPLWRWPYAGLSILAAMLIGTWTATGVLSYYYDLIPMFVGVTHTTNFQAYSDRMWHSFDLIYDKPYCRVAPYIIGVILGFILYKVKGRKNFLNWWQQSVGWILALFFSLSVVYGLYHVKMSRTTSLFYNALCRSSFTLGLAWLVFACETGHGSVITKILSWKLFIPLSRLTYSAYLVHPVLIHAYYFAYPAAFFFTEFLMVTNFLGFLLMSYGLAFAFSLVFESPLMNLEKLLIKRRSR